MAIDLGLVKKEELENQGSITTTTTAAGDLSGDFASPTVSAITGKAVPTTNNPEGTSLSNGPSGTLVWKQTLSEISTFGGDATGSQEGGLSVVAIRGISVSDSTPTNGQTLKYDGSEIVWGSDNSGYTQVITSTSITASNKNKVRADVSTSALTVTAPSSPTIGDEFIVYDVKRSAGTNNITIAVPTGDSIEGVLNETLVANVDGLMIEMYYDGSTWRFFAK